MPCCVFFGHKDADPSVLPRVKHEIEKLICDYEVNEFLVGNNGRFDYLAYTALKELKCQYPQIAFSVVLAYLPGTKTENEPYYSEEETLLPDGIENSLRRFAIDRRNRWMIEKADYVITYVTHDWGGAAKFKELAEKKKKTVINLP